LMPITINSLQMPSLCSVPDASGSVLGRPNRPLPVDRFLDS
jgi:hypothetical protein